MHPNDLLTHVRRRPFEPLRFYISDGSFYDVRHPEMIIVSRREVAIAVDATEGDLPEHMVYCDPLHITRVELINGAKPKRKTKKKKR
jgi:hypothetical protein